MTPFRENVRGIVSISVCNLVFLINDTLLKLVSDELPLGQILFIRGMFATALLFPIVAFMGRLGELRLAWHPTVFWRTFAEIAAAWLFLLALFHIPIANLNAILQVVPLMVTAVAAVFLRDRVGWRRWTAIVIGFLGVVIIIRPGLAGFDSWSLVALLSMLFITLRDLMTRAMPKGLSAFAVSLITAVSVGIGALVLGQLTGEAWVWPSTNALVHIAAATVFMIGGYITAVDFMRHGDIAVVAPFRYSVVIWAILVGYIVWGEVPDLPMLIGTAIIIATGVYTFQRERRLARMAAEAVDV